MKEWAEKRMKELEAVAEKDLAEVFQLVIKICELEDQLKTDRHLKPSPPLQSHIALGLFPGGKCSTP